MSLDRFLLAACAIVTGFGLAAPFPSEKPLMARSEAPASPQKTEKKAACVDSLGDPLPSGALLRLGSVRLRHRDQITAVVFSPDGKRLASWGEDRTIRLWDLKTGKELGQILGPKETKDLADQLFDPKGGVNRLAFTPDGKQLAGANDDGFVYLWDLATAKEVRRFPCSGKVWAVTISPRGNVLAVADEKRFRLWEIDSGKELWTVEAKGGFVAGTFSLAGDKVAGATADGKFSLWETVGGKSLHHSPEQVGVVHSFAFTPDGKSLLVSGERGTRFCEVATGKMSQPGPTMDPGGGGQLLSPDGKLLARVESANGSIRLFDWPSGGQVQYFYLPQLPISFIVFSPDSKTLAAVGSGAAIHLWDVATGKPTKVWPGHQEPLTSVAFLPDGRTAVTAGIDGTVRFWDAKTGQEVRRLVVDPVNQTGDNSERAFDVVVSPEGKQVAGVRGNGAGVMIWDVATGKEVRRFPGHCLAFSPDGKLIACGRGEHQLGTSLVHLHDRATGKQLRTLAAQRFPLYGITFTRDSKTLISRGFDPLAKLEEADALKFVRAWDVATGKEQRTFLNETIRTFGVILSPDGRTTASIGWKNNVELWETVTGGRRGTLEGHTDIILSVAFAPDGRTVATASQDGTLRLWDPQAGKEIGRLEGHLRMVVSVAFSPDGKTLISGSKDTTALIWDVSRFTHRLASTAVTLAELEECYSALGRDAVTGYQAVGKLTATPEQTVALLRQRLQPARGAELKRIPQLVADLQSKQFKVRDSATRELEKLAEMAAPALRKALTVSLPLDSRRRLEGLLNKLESATLSAETLRQVRAVEVLEAIGSPEARAVLEELAGGVVELRQTRKARAALQRWKGR